MTEACHRWQGIKLYLTYCQIFRHVKDLNLRRISRICEGVLGGTMILREILYFGYGKETRNKE